MLLGYLKLCIAAIAGSCLIPVVAIFASGTYQEWTVGDRLFSGCLAALLGGMLAAGLGTSLWQRRQVISELGLRTGELLDRWPIEKLPMAIVLSAATSLFLEMLVIRWQSSVFEVFAFYKNMTLLACFVGLGLGYALAREPQLPIVLSAPLLAWKVLALVVIRRGVAPIADSLATVPVLEQLHKGMFTPATAGHVASVDALLGVTYMLTALVFVPIGQLCGRLMERLPRLTAYGYNLLGSLLGVLLALGLNSLWLPPLTSYAIFMLGLLFFVARDRRLLGVTSLSALLLVLTLSIPSKTFFTQIYSPYQLLEVGPGDRGYLTIVAAGQYYQRIYNLADNGLGTDPKAKERSRVAAYYNLPYKVHGGSPGDVLVVGAGTGNDVAAALRNGARHVTAVEIDPAIANIGRIFHPEAPYDNPKATLVVDDARSFFRTDNGKYDIVVFGLLDSHTLLTHGASVRLDSFVYTVEALREARRLLKPDGTLSLAFSAMGDALGRKIYLMLQEAFDGRGPVCIAGGYDDGVFYLQTEGREISVPPDLLAPAGFHNKTDRYADPAVAADVSTDDWPFFYMPRRVYPVSYVGFVAVLAVVTLVMLGMLMPDRPLPSDAPFLLLGAGFMLVETKGITEFGLRLGNTWQVVGVVLIAILIFAYLSNAVVQRVRPVRIALPMAFLLGSLALGWLSSTLDVVPAGRAGQVIAAVLLTCPVFFSGIIFSILLNRTEHISRALAANMIGSLLGGVLEYNSMYFGFRSLYVFAIVLYGLAWLSTRWSATAAGMSGR
jgi:SAM-dependent methyltransferase